MKRLFQSEKSEEERKERAEEVEKQCFISRGLEMKLMQFCGLSGSRGVHVVATLASDCVYALSER